MADIHCLKENPKVHPAGYDAGWLHYLLCNSNPFSLKLFQTVNQDALIVILLLLWTIEREHG
jgi:hypothetical protein